MTRFDAWLLHISNGLVIITGLIYAWMAYFMESDDPYAIVGHPWQPHVQHAHVIVAPLLVLVLGYFWTRHIEPSLKFEPRNRRKSGLTMMITALPMIFSGYAIQIAVSELWRAVWVGVHLATAALWVVGYLIHLIVQPGDKTAQS